MTTRRRLNIQTFLDNPKAEMATSRFDNRFDFDTWVEALRQQGIPMHMVSVGLVSPNDETLADAVYLENAGMLIGVSVMLVLFEGRPTEMALEGDDLMLWWD